MKLSLSRYTNPCRGMMIILVFAFVVAMISSLAPTTAYAQSGATNLATCVNDVMESKKCQQKVTSDCKVTRGVETGDTATQALKKCESELVINGINKGTYKRKYSNATCDAKINLTDCRKEVDKKCQSGAPGSSSDSCRSSVIQKYKDVTPSCSNKQDAQACHKAVVRKCEKDPAIGTTIPQSRVRCIEGAISEFEARASSTEQTRQVDGPAKLDFSDGKSPGEYFCGNGDNKVQVKFNIGCIGVKYTGGSIGPIADMMYALIRFLSIGVGVVVIIAIIAAGVRYSTSQGNPEVTQSAKDNIQNAVIALIVYVFVFALVQYLVPGGVFKPGGVWISPDAYLLMERMIR